MRHPFSLDKESGWAEEEADAIVGSIAPTLYGAMIGNSTGRGPLAAGYYLGACIMIVGGIIALIFGVNTERQLLETITAPLRSVVGQTGQRERLNRRPRSQRNAWRSGDRSRCKA
ncbi:hypothetical protein GCM10027414_21550 [Humibacter ginsengiterrae]